MKQLVLDYHANNGWHYVCQWVTTNVLGAVPHLVCFKEWFHK